MIRTMLKPVLKKYFGLFISMAFVSMLSIGLLSSFVSTILNLKETFQTYIRENGNISAVASLGLTKIEDIGDIAAAVDEVESVEYRLSIDAFLKKEDGRTITVRLFTMKDDDSSVVKRYYIDRCDPSDKMVNVSVVRKFAENNGFKVGDIISIGYFGIYANCYINEIIETPEAIQARANNYVWSDNTDFGYIYFKEKQLDETIKSLAKRIEEKIKADEEFAKYYNLVVFATGSTIPDLVNKYVIDKNYTRLITNQILITAKDGYSEGIVANKVNEYLESKNVKIKSVTENKKMFYYVYIENAIRQLQVASIFLPVFFYSVTMIVIGLFINQIIKSMTPQIGVMMSIGAGKWDIILIFIVFTFLMTLVAGILGTVVGILLNRMLAKVMIVVYSMPTIPLTVRPLIAVIAVLSLMVFAVLTTIISCKQIFKITPKDATISNESKRKKIPPKLEKFIDKAPMNIKLGVNSIAQNPRRFFVSVFSIFASFVIILLACFFNVSKTELMEQTVERRLSFDAQVYLTSVADENSVNEIKNQQFISANDKGEKEFIDCYYTYVEVTDKEGNNKTYLECLAYDSDKDNSLINIPSKNGRGSLKIKENGLILPLSTAKTLGVKKCDFVLINGKNVEVTDLSYQYFHPITYLSKSQLKEFSDTYISSFLINVNDETAFLDYMSNNNASLTVFTKSLSKDIHSIFNSVDAFIYVLIGFSLVMAFIILTIMSQNALMEQKRQLSVFRAIGFTIMDISNLWTLQSVAQLILSLLFAVPVGSLAAIILFKLCSSASQSYPFILSVPVILFAFAFIFIIILMSHLISMFSIKKWNLADNTRTRE